MELLLKQHGGVGGRGKRGSLFIIAASYGISGVGGGVGGKTSKLRERGV